MHCTDDETYDPVCGTNGITYANDCLFSIAKCQYNIELLYHEPCGKYKEAGLVHLLTSIANYI